MIVHRGWLQHKHVQTMHYRLGIWDESLSMMIGRAGWWMEWSGLVKGRAGDGDGDGDGEGGGGEGKGRGVVTVPF